MRLEGGQQVFSVGGQFVSVHPLATDSEIETAIRSVAPATATTPLPAVSLTEVKPAMTAPSATGFKPGEISALFQSLRDRKAAMLDAVKANGADVLAIVVAGEQMADALKAEGDELRKEFGLITNFPPV